MVQKKSSDLFSKNRKTLLKKIKGVHMLQAHQTVYARYGISILVPLSLFLVKELLLKNVGRVSPFFLSSFVIISVAFFGGLGPGVVATILTCGIIIFSLWNQNLLTSNDLIIEIIQLLVIFIGGILVSFYVSKRKDESIQAQKQITHQSVIADISQNKIKDQSLDEWLSDSLTLICKTLQMDYGAIFEYEPQRSALYITSVYGVKDKNIKNSIPATKELDVFASLSSDKVITNRYSEKNSRVSFFPQDSIKKGITVQIRGRYRPYGVLVLYSRRNEDITKYEKRFVEIIATVIANTIERNTAIKVMEIIADSTTRISSNLDLSTTLKIIGEFIVPKLADWTQVIFLNDTLSIGYTYAKGRQASQLFNKLPTEYSIDKKNKFIASIAKGKPIILSILQNNLSYLCFDKSYFSAVQKLNTQSVMIVPLLSRKKTIGCIIFGANKNRKIFELQDLIVASEITNRAATAIDNAILFHEAEDAIRSRDEFLSIASHELKTPLTSMLLQLQSILHSIKNESLANFSIDKTVKLLESTKRQSDKLTKLVNDLLNISLITTGRMNLETEEINLPRMTREIVDRFEEQTYDQKPNISIESDKNVIGRWDKVRIEQVISNLVSNAIKYGKGNPIKIKVKQHGANAYFSIQDRGIGIPTEQQRRIFSRFERGIPTRDYEGLGVGLYIVQQIINKHRGTISVESELGKGTTFSFTIPLRPFRQQQIKTQ